MSLYSIEVCGVKLFAVVLLRNRMLSVFDLDGKCGVGYARGENRNTPRPSLAVGAGV